MPPDYYETLGVSRGATERELKRAFRRLAKELHPDCTGGCPRKAARFKAVSEAYAFLSDPERRALYDQFGEVGTVGADGMGFDVQSVLEDLGSAAAGFGIDFESFFGGGGRSRSGGGRKGKDIAVGLHVGMLEALSGGDQTVTFTSGEGAEQRVRVHVPAGSRTGDVLRVPGRGSAGARGGRPGDLRVELTVVPHPALRWVGETLEMDLPLTCLEAYRGASIQVGTLQGPVRLKVPPGVRTGRKLRLRGKGPIVRGERSDLILRLCVELPPTANEEVASAFERVEAAYGECVRSKLPTLA